MTIAAAVVEAPDDIDTVDAVGEDVLEDDVEAYAWFNVAVANGVKTAVKLRDNIKQAMTPEQITEGQKRSRQIMKSISHDFVDNQVRLQLFALAYNIGNFLRRLVLPPRVKHWTLTTMREKLIKIGAKVVRHSKYVFFQMAEVAVPRKLFAAILERIQRLRAVLGMAPS